MICAVPPARESRVWQKVPVHSNSYGRVLPTSIFSLPATTFIFFPNFPIVGPVPLAATPPRRPTLFTPFSIQRPNQTSGIRIMFLLDSSSSPGPLLLLLHSIYTSLLYCKQILPHSTRKPFCTLTPHQLGLANLRSPPHRARTPTRRLSSGF